MPADARRCPCPGALEMTVIRMLYAFRLVALLTAVFIAPKSVLSREPHWPDSLTIGTASPGGTYHAYGEGLARILTRELGIPVLALPTEGPNQNIALLEADRIQLAFVTLGVALQAWNGTGSWTEGKQLRTMRAIFPMYDTPFQFAVLRDSGIQSIADLRQARRCRPARGHLRHLHPRILQDAQNRREPGPWRLG